MPLLARLLSHFTPHATVLTGPYALGRASIYLNALGFLFLLFTSITFNFPTVYPVDRDNMNYTSAAVAVIGGISLLTWVVQGRREFTGPRVVLGARAGGVGTGGSGSGSLGGSGSEEVGVLEKVGGG